MTSSRRWLTTGGALLALAACAVALTRVDAIGAQALAATLLMAVIPGWLSTSLLVGSDGDLLVAERALLACGLGYVSVVLGMLALQALPGPLTRSHLVGLYLALSLVLLAARVLRGRDDTPPRAAPRTVTLTLLGLFLLAVALRAPGLGHSEFQGDEGRAVLRATEVLLGNDEVLLLHKKGPVEILLPASLYAATGRMSEWLARAPFGIAGIAAVLALAALGRRLYGLGVGVIAGTLMAVDGFWVGFSRIVQYQSVVLLMTILVVFCVYRVAQGAAQRRAYLGMAALMASVGLLAHYEGFFALPPAAYLMWEHYREQEPPWRTALKDLWLSLALGGVAVGVFYVPFVMHPQFGDTVSYLGVKRIGGGLLYNNIADYFQRAGFYSSAYHVLLLGIGLLAVAGWALWRGCAGRRQRLELAALGLAWLIAILFPSLWQVGTTNLSIVLFGITVALLLRARLRTEHRLLVIWFSAAALLYFFLMLKVHTHYYVALPPWALAVGLGGVSAWEALRRRGDALVLVAAALAVVLVGLTANYVRVAMVRPDREFKHTYPASRPHLYWAPYGPVAPRGGYFGFPYRTAWKAIGGMYDAGLLTGAYDSNQEDLVTNWYTRGAMRCPDSDFFVVARDVENPHLIVPGVINGEYMPAWEIVRGGEPQLWVFQSGYSGAVERLDYDVLAASFLGRSAPVFRVGAPLDETFDPPNQVGARFDEVFELTGWALDLPVVAPGDDLVLTLYWQSLRETTADYHVFAHLGDGDPVAQSDSVPQCGTHPTYRWRQGEQVVERRLLKVRPDAGAGVLPLRVGLYEYPSKDRLHASDGSGADLGSSLHITSVRVGTPAMQPPSPYRVDSVALGSGVGLVGYDLPEEPLLPGDRLNLRLYWQCLAPMDVSYTVFLHLVGPDGSIAVQRDAKPQDGALPTDFWMPGEYVADEHVLEVPEGSAAGEYELRVGMYDVATGQRLPANRGGLPLPHDQITLGKVGLGDG